MKNTKNINNNYQSKPKRNNNENNNTNFIPNETDLRMMNSNQQHQIQQNMISA